MQTPEVFPSMPVCKDVTSENNTHDVPSIVNPAQFGEVMHQLRLCSNPEASHFVERAALYLFASI